MAAFHKRILLVEDSATIRRIVSAWLMEERYEVIECECFDQVIELPIYDDLFAVVTDIVLPGMSGLEAIEVLRRRYRDLSIIAISGGDVSKSSEEILYRARQLGADRFLVKPFEKSDLLDAIKGASGLSSQRSEKGAGTVLLIDDSRTVRMAVQRMLEGDGFSVMAAETAEEAFESNDILGVDVVLTDIFMPGEGGIELIRRIKCTWPYVSVVAMSGGHNEDMKGQTALQAAAMVGADATINKPFSRDKVVALVSELMQAKEGDTCPST